MQQVDSKCDTVEDEYEIHTNLLFTDDDDVQYEFFDGRKKEHFFKGNGAIGDSKNFQAKKRSFSVFPSQGIQVL